MKKSFTEAELEWVYGKNKVPKDLDQLARTSVCAPSFGKAERQVSRESKSLLAKLRSIALDAQFVSLIRLKSKWPLYGNLRQGVWYFESPPDGTCRFRSMDGHGRSWAFHLSRSNIPFCLEAIAHQGAVIVDATRMGKIFPDAFNRTVPLWCAVINRALGFHSAVVELPDGFPPGEGSKISSQQLSSWAEDVKPLLLPQLLGEKDKILPLKPFWIANDPSFNLVAARAFDHIGEGEYIPIVCVSCSLANLSPAYIREHFGFAYFPGAADDEENWSLGLSSHVFWANWEMLLNCQNDQEVADKITEIVLKTDLNVKRNEFVQIHAPRVLARWGNPCGEKEENPVNTVDISWVKASDKSWSRKNPHAWQKHILPLLLDTFNKRLVEFEFVMVSHDADTALTAALAVMIYSVLQSGHVFAKDLLKQKEAQLVQETNGLVIPRRLIKELSIYFGAAGVKKDL